MNRERLLAMITELPEGSNIRFSVDDTANDPEDGIRIFCEELPEMEPTAPNEYTFFLIGESNGGCLSETSLRAIGAALVNALTLDGYNVSRHAYTDTTMRFGSMGNPSDNTLLS